MRLLDPLFSIPSILPKIETNVQNVGFSPGLKSSLLLFSAFALSNS
jgi:hypothetical protein